MKEVAKLQIKDRTELFQAAAISMGENYEHKSKNCDRKDCEEKIMPILT